ncbi:MAG: hypothetical protein WAN86_20710 [Hyphomicrobiaceae bacterium]
MCRHHVLRRRIEDDARLRAERQPPGVLGRQEDRHVHIGQIEQGQNLAASGQHFARQGEPVLHTPRARRPQNGIVELRLDALDLGRGRFDHRLGERDLRARVAYSGFGCKLGGTPLIDRLPRGNALVHELQRAGELLVGEGKLAATLGEKGDRLVELLLALPDTGLSLAQVRLELSRIHAGEPSQRSRWRVAAPSTVSAVVISSLPARQGLVICQ